METKIFKMLEKALLLLICPEKYMSIPFNTNQISAQLIDVRTNLIYLLLFLKSVIY